MASILTATTLLIATRMPLRLGFLTALPGLTQLLTAAPTSQPPVSPKDKPCGFYVISSTASRTCNIPGCTIFMLASDSEAGFIYSPNGIDGLSYNAGDKGHLIGDWYWMVED